MQSSESHGSLPELGSDSKNELLSLPMLSKPETKPSGEGIVCLKCFLLHFFLKALIFTIFYSQMSTRCQRYTRNVFVLVHRSPRSSLTKPFRPVPRCKREGPPCVLHHLQEKNALFWRPLKDSSPLFLNPTSTVPKAMELRLFLLSTDGEPDLCTVIMYLTRFGFHQHF